MLKLECHTNRIDENVAIWVLSDYVNKTLSNALKSRVCAEHKSALITTSLRNNDARSQKLFLSCTQVINYHLKQFAMD